MWLTSFVVTNPPRADAIKLLVSLSVSVCYALILEIRKRKAISSM